MTTYSYNDILEILFVNTFINQKVLKSKKEKSFYTYLMTIIITFQLNILI